MDGTVSNRGSGPVQSDLSAVNDMDIDMDIDFTIDPEVEVMEGDMVPTATSTQNGAAPSTSPINPFDGSVAGATEPIPEKVHIRGLDNLDTFNLKAFISTHYESAHFVRIEWIDDTSANFIYDTPEAASEALRAFTDTDSVDVGTIHPLQLRPAKKLSADRNGQVEIYELQVRQATASDVKRRGARDVSRYYLMNPDKDPRERRTKERHQRVKESGETGDYKRLRFDEREHKRRRQDDALDASMYDDDIGAASSDDHDRRKRVRFGQRNSEDLFDNRNSGRLRDRSASPLRDGDGRFGFGSDPDESMVRRKIRQRSLTPPRLRNPPTTSHTFSNAGKELFSAEKSVVLAPSPTITELFPSKAGPEKFGKELFPTKTKVSKHRRSDAIDASPERYSHNDSPRPRSLADRITLPGSNLADRITGGPSDDLMIRGSAPVNIRGAAPVNIRGAAPLNIKGSAGQRDSGFSIRGAAQSPNDEGAAGVKELFPMKSGANAGKELFGEKLKGRGGPRTAAASFF